MKIAVIGAGWLGLPLCERLQANDKQVVASKREPEDAEQLTFKGIDTFAYQLGNETLPEAFSDAQVYVINIGGGRRRIEKALFQEQMINLCKQCLTDKNRQLLFVSSTSVYGERVRDIKEDSEVEPISDSALAHVAIEDFLMSTYPKQTTILRLAGLISEDRHPAVHFEGKKNVTAAHKCVNLVHREDVLMAIECIVDKKLWGRVFHLCASEHPQRREYYCWAAEQLGLVPPVFLDESEQPTTGKKVDASDTLTALGMTLKYPSPFDMIAVTAEQDDTLSESKSSD